jgi:hypothetical protein
LRHARSSLRSGADRNCCHSRRISYRPIDGRIARPPSAIRTFRAAEATQQLHDLGQSIWLDNITRDLLTSGTLKRYIDELSVTGLTANPTIFDHAIKNSTSYDAAIREKLKEGKSGERLFFRPFAKTATA